MLPLDGAPPGGLPANELLPGDEVKRRTDPDNIFRNLYAQTCLATRGLEAPSG